MRIAIMIDSLAIGGAQKHVRQLACGLAEQGHTVTVWVLNEIVDGVYAKPLESAGVKIKIVGRRRVAGGLGLFQVASQWWRERVDVVVVVLFVSTVIGRLAAQLAGGIPVVTSLQARNIDYRWWQKGLVRMTAFLSAMDVSNSRTALSWAIRHEGISSSRSGYIANFLDPPRDSQRVLSWAEMGLSQLQGKRVVGSLGRLVVQKGYDVLLEAIPLLRGRPDEGTVFAVFGEGPERIALERQRERLGLGGRVFFPGTTPYVESVLAHLSLYVQPSRFEGTPQAVLEAMAAGVPVLASAVDGITEVVAGADERHRTVPAEDAAALASGIQAMLTPDVAGAKPAASSVPRLTLLGGSLDDWKRVFSAVCGIYSPPHPAAMAGSDSGSTTVRTGSHPPAFWHPTDRRAV